MDCDLMALLVEDDNAGLGIDVDNALVRELGSGIGNCAACPDHKIRSSVGPGVGVRCWPFS